MSRVTPTLMLAALAALACADPSGPALRPGEGRVLLRVESGLPAGAAATETITLGNDVLVLDRVEMVLRDIELERAGVECRRDDEDDDCEKVVLGPVHFDVPLGSGPDRPVAAAVPAGRYEEVEFEIHKPDDDRARDRAFLAQHPDLRKVSIRVRGSFNGRPFLWLSDLNEEQEIELRPPLVVEEGQEVTLTLAVDLRSWFKAGGALIDPATALKGGPNENRVRDNIRRSIRGR